MKNHSKTPGGLLFWTLAFLVWLGFAVVAVAGGIFRVMFLESRLGSYAANVVETLGLAVLLAWMIWLVMPWLVPALEKQNLKRLGFCWFALTIAFEFLFGHFVDGASWSVLFSNYDITAGRLWILVPLTLGFGPIVAGWMKHRSETIDPQPVGSKA